MGRQVDTVPSMTTAVPILAVSDVDQALLWWRRLGFTEEFRHVFEPGLPRFVGIRRDECHVYLSEHRGDASGPSLIYLWVEDVDGVAREFGAMVDEMPWARDCEITDPDGNRVRVATR
jgi:catechol 2,3-dioxygenase-like lactoylglutathione lyase family enzyme